MQIINEVNDVCTFFRAGLLVTILSNENGFIEQKNFVNFKRLEEYIDSIEPEAGNLICLLLKNEKEAGVFTIILNESAHTSVFLEIFLMFAEKATDDSVAHLLSYYRNKSLYNNSDYLY